jgi:hypothetical protein
MCRVVGTGLATVVAVPAFVVGAAVVGAPVAGAAVVGATVVDAFVVVGLTVVEAPLVVGVLDFADEPQPATSKPSANTPDTTFLRVKSMRRTNPLLSFGHRLLPRPETHRAG